MWSDAKLNASQADVDQIRRALSRNEVAPTAELVAHIMTALSQNLNTPLAISSLLAWVEQTEAGVTGGSTGELSRALDSALGLAF